MGYRAFYRKAFSRKLKPLFLFLCSATAVSLFYQNFVRLGVDTSLQLANTNVLYPNAHQNFPYVVYSPEILKGTDDSSSKLFMGGWLNKSDVGPDKLYVANRINGTWGGLQEIQWENTGFSRGNIPNYHLNDPTVVTDSSNKKLIMFFTALRNDFATEAVMTKRNWIGYATSTNGGNSWKYEGILLGQNNGFDNTGAWSPSAKIVGDEIWIYYHTGSAHCTGDQCVDEVLPTRVMRSRLKLNDLQLIETNPIYNQDSDYISLANVDVSISGMGLQKIYHLVGNSPDMKTLRYYRSFDGANFYPVEATTGNLVIGGPNWVFTPVIKEASNNRLKISFNFSGKTSADGNPDITQTSLHDWDFNVAETQHTSFASLRLRRNYYTSMWAQVFSRTPSSLQPIAQESANKKFARLAFLKFFHNLKQAKLIGVKGVSLQPWLDACNSGRIVATAWSVDTSNYQCK